MNTCSYGGETVSSFWYRIERRDASGRVRDWVEVGRCANCGRGVDREFPAQYRILGGELYCRACALPQEPAAVRPARTPRPATTAMGG
jgi:hypothetical protein